MAIIYQENVPVWNLETKTSTYQIKADELGTLWHTYYGEKATAEDLSFAFRLAARGHSANPHETGMQDRQYSLETIPQEMSAFGGADVRTTGIRVRVQDGSETLRLKYERFEIIDGKYALPGLPAAYDDGNDAKTLMIRLTDPEAHIAVELYYGVFEDADVITRATRVVNESNETVKLEKAASLDLDFIHGEYDLITFNGRWARERIPERNPLRQGMNSIGSVRGFSSARFNPSAILAERDATETAGNAYGLAFVYSGEFLLEAERDTTDATRVLLGIHPDHFEWTLQPGESFTAPEALLTYSPAGIGGISLRFHRFINEHIVRGKWKNDRRPVLINNWEGTYFNFTGDKIVEMARAAAETGVELFVLDDGWFGKRDNDRSGLGDWFPNETKLGCSLTELGDRIRATGLKFGLWFEPETVSEDSELYRAHPDWAVRIPGREPALCRYELLLDVSRTDVQDYLIKEISARIREAKLDYIKWDLNRSMSDRYSAALSADRQGEMTHRFTLGTYRILESLRTEFPDLLIEGCSSGGARFDCGMLYYTPQIWTSDDTDAIERLWIQYGTSMIYPVKTMGAHVSAVPNHQTGRVTSLKTRATVAMSGTFGYELDSTKLSAGEKEEIRRQIETFKSLYELLENGNYYRLVPPTADSATVWEQAAKDGSRALVNIVYHAVRPCPLETVFRLQGLRDEKQYRLSLVDPGDLEKLDPRQRTLFDGKILSGRALRLIGLYAPLQTNFRGGQGGDYPAYQILIEEV